MSLRTKLLVMFTVLAVLPLALVGAIDYLHSVRAVEAHLAAQVERIADRTTAEVERRYQIHRSDLLLLAENAETQRLFRAASEGGQGAGPSPGVSAFFQQAWAQYAPWYHAIELRDQGGRVLYRLGEPTSDGRPAGGDAGGGLVSEQPIRDSVSGRDLGSVVAFPRHSALLPPHVLEAQFGESGHTVVLDRRRGRILLHTDAADPTRAKGAPAAAPPEGRRGIYSFRENGALRVAAFVRISAPAWTVVTSSAVDEFAAPFARIRMLNLLLVGLVIAAVSLVSTLLIRRETRSLAELTTAAERVGRGDFTPRLPPAGRDEVGRLADAFASMTTRVQEMMEQMEARRQMAAVGEFAAELAHEIRNPLTSVKLNLQRIQRAADAGRVSPEAERPLAISLREIQRLERVVRGVLHLARSRSAERRPCSPDGAAREALELVAGLAAERGVRVEAELGSEPALVLGDPEQLRAAVLNLLLNAVDAMPLGGVLRVWSVLQPDGPAGEVVELHVADTGSGIAPEAREQVFRPFFTTKTDGTGLGLAVALRTVEEHGGQLAVAATGAAGTEMVIRLPVAEAGVGV